GLTTSIGSRLRTGSITNTEGMEVRTAATMGMQDIALSTIRVEGVNVRAYFDEEALQQLAKSMQQHGLLQPIIVAPEPNEAGTWRLIAGERRLRAAKQLGWSTIPARVLPLPPEQWKAVMMSENTLREDLTLGEELEGYTILREELGNTEAVADLLGVSRAYLHPLLRIWRHPRAREAIADGTIQSKAIARVVSLLVDNEGNERVPGLLDQAIAFCADKHPSKARLKAYVDGLLHPLSQEVPPPRPRAQKTVSSFVVHEEQRLNKIAKDVIPELSPHDRNELRKIYQAVLAYIDDVNPGLQQSESTPNRKGM
ncbi:MAG: ParB/RepB/Spo0J family partition protein, partial [Sulfobacillus thermotolerans]|nr:ParB/RepB/Spo0J family partition protein [Sulfobacillus thermotolerans]